MAYGFLYAGGAFDTDDTGNVTLPRLARWAGGVWQPVGGGMDGDVFAIQRAGTSLWAGGNFETAGTTRSVHIAEYAAFPNPVITKWGLNADPQYVSGEFMGIPGQSYRLETSPDLLVWTTQASSYPASLGIAAGSLPAGLGSFGFPRNSPRYFFRIRLAP